MDLTEDDVAQGDVLQGKKFHGRDGVSKTGSYVPPVLIPKTIKKNGTYDPTDDNADGYSSVEVDVTGVGIKVTDPIAYRAANRDPNYPDVPLPSEITDNGDWFYLLYSAKDKFVCPTFQLNGGTLISAKRCKYLNKTLIAESDISLVLGTNYYREQFDSDDSDWGDYNYILYKINISGATTIAFYNYTYNGTESNASQSSCLIEASIKATNLTTATIYASNLRHYDLEYFSMTGYKGNTAANMFRGCSALKAICELETPNATNMTYMFYQCYSLQAIPLFDTSNVTNMANMFYDCHSLTTIPSLNTANVTSMASMFRNCRVLETIPKLDTANVTNMAYMFAQCNILGAIPNLSTPLVNTLQNMLESCFNLQSVGTLNFSSVSSLVSLDPYGYLYSLVSFNATGMKASFRLSGSNFLSESAIVVILNNLATVSTTQTLTLGATNLAKLTAEEKAIATNKGWTLA